MDFDGLDADSPRAAYLATCEETGVKPNVAVCNCLSPVPHDYDAVDEIRLGTTYIGRKGLLALLPTLAKCHRIEKVGLQQNGLGDDDVMVQLIRTLQSCPELRHIDLSGNDVGSRVGVAIVNLLRSKTTPKLTEVNLHDTMVVLPITNKIKRLTAQNLTNLVALNVTPLSQAIIQDLPEEWVYDCLEAVAAALFKHRHHMQDIWSMFEADVTHGVPLAKFTKILRMIDADALLAGTAEEVERRLTTMAEVLGLRGKDGIFVRDMFAKLRVHATFRPYAGKMTDELQSLLDGIFDHVPYLTDVYADKAPSGQVPTQEFKDCICQLKICGPVGALSATVKAEALELLSGYGLNGASVAIADFLDLFEVSKDPAEHDWWSCSFILTRCRGCYRPGTAASVTDSLV
mmetsp:Transcript_11893/g.21879  ORF Transcript_11893/g.21879 Transcript_11893/m.21879 type:complete len:402 (-) Transcript_11893:9-1214(-)